MIDGVRSGPAEMRGAEENTSSREHLIESEDLCLDVLHPGGVAMPLELALLCHVSRDTRVLDVACRTSESICRLAGESESPCPVPSGLLSRIARKLRKTLFALFAKFLR